MRHTIRTEYNGVRDRPRCLEGTRVGILRILKAWGLSFHSAQIFLLSGHAGSGKSTIAQSFAELLFSVADLGAAFFCSRNEDLRNNLATIFPTIAYQLAHSNHSLAPEYRKVLLHKLRENPDLPTSSLQEQFDALIVGPINQSGMSTVIIIDALDERKNNEATSTFLSFLAENVVRVRNIKFFITSRLDRHIQPGFLPKKLEHVLTKMTLHDGAMATDDDDIHSYVRTELSALAENRKEINPETSFDQNEVKKIARISNGLFIVAVTVTNILGGTDEDMKAHLQKVLKDLDSPNHGGESSLDSLYIGILDYACCQRDAISVAKLHSILGVLAVSNDLMTAATVAEVLDTVESAKDVLLTLGPLSLLLTMPRLDDPNETLQFRHQSFLDFLTDSERCTDPRFHISLDSHHLVVAQQCLNIMEQKLERNICQLPPYSLNNNADTDRYIDSSLRYCCRYVANHLHASIGRDQYLAITQSLRNWLETRLLQWIEVLALLHELDRAVESLSDLQEWLIVVRPVTPNLCRQANLTLS
jgi:energy-coupling factor transporter ATP-binding protein EcfA2